MGGNTHPTKQTSIYITIQLSQKLIKNHNCRTLKAVQKFDIENLQLLNADDKHIKGIYKENNRILHD